MVLRVAMVLEVTMAVEAKWCKDDTKLVDITIIKDNTKLGDLCTPPPPCDLVTNSIFLHKNARGSRKNKQIFYGQADRKGGGVSPLGPD